MDISWWYYAKAALIGVIVWRIWKKPSLGLLAGYSVLLLAETVLIRTAFSGAHFQPAPFWSWRQFSVQKNQILTNIIMFVPVGMLTGWLWKWRGLLFAVGLSIVIELLQLVTACGLCEFDDVFHNMIGAVIGIVIIIVMRKIEGKEEYR